MLSEYWHHAVFIAGPSACSCGVPFGEPRPKRPGSSLAIEALRAARTLRAAVKGDGALE